MSSELAMNAYVLLGNALHYFVNGLGAPPESGIGSDLARALYVHIEPKTPNRIIEAVAELPADQKTALGAVCRYVIMQTAPEQTSTILGLPPEVIDQTLAELGL